MNISTRTNRLSIILCTTLIVVSLLDFNGCGGGGGGGDVTPPTTTASPPSGLYGTFQSLTLAANEPATIYYTLDGTLPAIGGAATISGAGPISGITVSHDSTLVQFFAVDSSGNREPVKSETYVIINGAAAGPGDQDNYMPLNPGNGWNFEGTITEAGTPSVAYVSSTSVAGTTALTGVTVAVVTESNPGNAGAAVEEYLFKNSQGITYLGNNDPADAISRQLVPYQAMLFTLPPGSSFVQADKSGLDFGQDLDLDGKNETVDVNSLVTLKSLETVTVPAGVFPGCARIETDTTLAVTLSYSKSRVVAASTQTRWYAPGVGPVKSTTVTTAGGLSETDGEELDGCIIAAPFFGPASKFAAGSNPSSMTIGDFNGDGKPDLAVTNNGGNTVTILLGTGLGSFGTATALAVGTYPVSAAVGDFNGDGKADLAVASNTAVTNNANVSLLLGAGDGSFGSATPFVVDPLLGGNLASVRIGDFNGDGKPDVATANAMTGGIRNNTVSILLGDGAGALRPVIYFVAVGDSPASLATGDFNGDGKADLAVANNAGSVSVFLNTAP